MQIKFLVLACLFFQQQTAAADYIEVITGGIRAGTVVTKEVFSTFEGISKILIGSFAKKDFERALRGGHAIYLDEDRKVHKAVVPTIVPFKIEVTGAKVRFENGAEVIDNATRSAKALFDGEVEAKTLVRERKIMRDDFGRLQNPAPGQRYVFEVEYRCLDDRGSFVREGKKAQAHQMNNIVLSCLDVPSVYNGKFGQ